MCQQQCDTPSRLSTFTKVNHKIRMSNRRYCTGLSQYFANNFTG